MKPKLGENKYGLSGYALSNHTEQNWMNNMVIKKGRSWCRGWTECEKESMWVCVDLLAWVKVQKGPVRVSSSSSMILIMVSVGHYPQSQTSANSQAPESSQQRLWMKRSDVWLKVALNGKGRWGLSRVFTGRGGWALLLGGPAHIALKEVSVCLSCFFFRTFSTVF